MLTVTFNIYLIILLLSLSRIANDDSVWNETNDDDFEIDEHFPLRQWIAAWNKWN
jgi:hypothetical protein